MQDHLHSNVLHTTLTCILLRKQVYYYCVGDGSFSQSLDFFWMVRGNLD